MAGYLWNDDVRAHLGWSVNVLTLRGERIAEITSFIGPDHFALLGLPTSLPRSGTDELGPTVRAGRGELVVVRPKEFEPLTF